MSNINAHPCQKQYYQTKIELVPLIDIIEPIIDDDAKTLTYFFPYPFQLVAFADIGPWTPSPLPVFENPINQAWNLKQTAAMGTYASSLLRDMFSVMMFANRDYGDYINSPFLGSITYQEHTIAKFANYFQGFENKDLQIWKLNTFLSPESLVVQFWQDQVAIAQPPQVQYRFLDLLNKIFKISDRTLWGAPGIYTVYYGEPVIGGSRYITNSTCQVG